MACRLCTTATCRRTPAPVVVYDADLNYTDAAIEEVGGSGVMPFLKRIAAPLTDKFVTDAQKANRGNRAMDTIGHSTENPASHDMSNLDAERTRVTKSIQMSTRWSL